MICVTGQIQSGVKVVTSAVLLECKKSFTATAIANLCYPFATPKATTVFMTDHSKLMREFPPTTDEQVVIDNMQEAPFNRWAFCNMRRLLPTGNVSRGQGPVFSLQASPVDLTGIEIPLSDGQVSTVGQVFADEFTDGLVVLHKGKLVTEHYRDGVNPHEPHLLMSVTKSVAGSLTGILVERGLLSPDDQLTDIIPEVSGSAYDDAQLRHLLDMTIGMDFSEDYENPQSDVALLDVAAGWRAPRKDAVDNIRDFLRNLQKVGEHGMAFNYVSANTDLLGWVLERVSGVDFATLLSREIWQPMGAEHDAYITLDKLGAPQTDGGLCTTTRDLARFGQLHLQNGKIGDRQIIPKSWIQDFQQNGNAEVWDRGNFAEAMPDYHYRSKWYTKLSDPNKPYRGIGIHGQFVVVDPVTEVVIAHHASHPDPVSGRYFGELDRAFTAICQHLSSS